MNSAYKRGVYETTLTTGTSAELRWEPGPELPAGTYPLELSGHVRGCRQTVRQSFTLRR